MLDHDERSACPRQACSTSVAWYAVASEPWLLKACGPQVVPGTGEMRRCSLSLVRAEGAVLPCARLLRRLATLQSAMLERPATVGDSDHEQG